VATINPEREQQRLAELYAGMAEGELERLAREVASLTQEAREALRLELVRRGLQWTLAVLSAPIRESSLEPGPITLRRFRDLPDALLAKTILDSASIECFLADENIVRMNWLYSNAIGGIQLWVRPGDAEASELLDQDYVEAFSAGGTGEYKQPHCPHCGSSDVSFRGLKKRAAYASILIAWLLFFPLFSFREIGWKCGACERVWQDSGDSKV
jgi:hypothetical protein